MLKWIESSKTESKVEPRARAWGETGGQQQKANTLLELVDLFDAIDTGHTGLVPIDAVERFLCGELLTDREQKRLLDRANCYGSTSPARSTVEFVRHIDHIRLPRRARFLTECVGDQKEWSVVISAREHMRRASTFAQKPETTTPSTVRQATLYRIIGARMEKLSKFLDQECRGEEDNLVGDDECVLTKGLEQASEPGLWQVTDNPSSLEQAAAAGDSSGAGTMNTLRLARLYWRYLLGSAMHQQLRDSEEACYLELRSDGKLDLVGFMCILAHDEVIGLFPKGNPPTAELIRKTAYAAQSRI